MHVSHSVGLVNHVCAGGAPDGGLLLGEECGLCGAVGDFRPIAAAPRTAPPVPKCKECGLTHSDCQRVDMMACDEACRQGRDYACAWCSLHGVHRPLATFDDGLKHGHERRGERNSISPFQIGEVVGYIGSCPNQARRALAGQP